MPGDPEEGEPGPTGPGECVAEARRLGIDLAVAEEVRGHPDGRPDLTCSQPEPIRVSFPLREVDWRYFDHDAPRDTFMACDLALALYRLAEILTAAGVVEVEHLGVYNCRLIGGTDELSEHALARAIDPHAFIFEDGSECNVETDWEGLHGEPQTFCGGLLQDLAWEMHLRGLFNVVLTPDFNAAHHNHFHIDLSPGGSFLG